MVDDIVRQAAGQQAFARFVPVQSYQLAKALGLLRVIEKGRFLQLQLTRFTVEQANTAQGKLGLADIQVCQADRAIDHPVRFMPGRHHAQLVGCPFVAGALAAKGAGAVGDVARQGVMARCLVIAGIVAVAPQRCRQPVAQVRAQLQAGMGRGVHGVEHLQLGKWGHGRFLLPAILLRLGQAYSHRQDKCASLCKRVGVRQENTEMPRRGLRPRFAGEPAPTGTAPASRAARSLWERL
ncbi:conserved protein of unknown function [Pseudomonas sp. JV551A1]|uniref:Uncharacterized protein n=1 Tax=Pseudomonas inefficax TaxID=2078786 RepID=A0AAQ1PE86_9PSED|nr:conserved protein of unknown function [Pseudomonas sp. JV551A1]SPO63594.1 conserved protein of unknown function [Pseudomonas inefficax]